MELRLIGLADMLELTGWLSNRVASNPSIEHISSLKTQEKLDN
jgi:hypothetical protein